MKKIICKIFRHKYAYVKRLSSATHQLSCKRCKKLFAINTSVKTVLEWDLELEDLYYTLPKSDQIEEKIK